MPKAQFRPVLSVTPNRTNRRPYAATCPGRVWRLGTDPFASRGRQPFLDAARVLIAAGYDPDNWLEGWRPGATAFALRARLGIAAGLTVDETKTVFAKWKPFSLSAVASSIDHSEIPATTLAAAPSALLQPQLEQQSKQTSEPEPGARPASSVADKCTDRIPANFNNASSSSSRA